MGVALPLVCQIHLDCMIDGRVGRFNPEDRLREVDGSHDLAVEICYLN
jgi:hypothetical protein